MRLRIKFMPRLEGMTAEEVQAKAAKDGLRWGALRLKRGRVHEITVYKDGTYSVREIGPSPEPE
jgi:hypothetical protein